MNAAPEGPVDAGDRVKIAPSILACDFAHLADECRRAEDAGADALHVDVMDGHYVPNITIGPLVVEALRRSTGLTLNVHLMIEEPAAFARQFLEAGADCLVVHAETPESSACALEAARGARVRTGVAVNPETPFAQALPFAADVDFILVMTVRPGFGGQEFMAEALPKLAEARAVARDGAEFGVDGGVNLETAREALRAGADFLVAGTFLFRSDDMAQRVAELRRIAAEEGVHGLA